MKKIIKTFSSPYFKNEKRKILIWEPKKINKATPVLFFFDGQILKTQEREFNQLNGIDVFSKIKKIDNFIVIAVNSMSANDCFKYKKRKKELLNKDQNQNYLFFEKVKEKIIDLKNKYQGKWFGFGFSLSGLIIANSKKLFDQTILISPYFKNQIFKLPTNSIVFYGTKEYKFFSKRKVNNPILKIKTENKNVNFIEIYNLKHTFVSWDKYFLFILKCSVKPFLHFDKLNQNGVGKYLKGNSNISFLNKNLHLKIKANNIDNGGLEKKFIQKTHYKNDYTFLDKITYLKKFYKGTKVKRLNKNNIIALAKELKKLHLVKISKTIPVYKTIPFKDKLVMSHGDLNPKNVIFSQNKAFFLDFEWARLNSKYWDICYIFLSFNLNNREKRLFYNCYGIKPNEKKELKMIKHLTKILKNFPKDFPNYFTTK